MLLLSLCCVLCSDADSLRWCLHIASALQYLHGGRPAVIHRDLKLDNVMLSCADVARADAKLADFGLARLAAAEDRHTLGQM
jgi:serine/threonine protein kinase